MALRAAAFLGAKKALMFKLLAAQQHEVFLDMLRDRRQTLGMAQVELARRLGQTQAMVSRVETGARRLDVIELRDWLRVLDLDTKLRAAPSKDFGFEPSERAGT